MPNILDSDYQPQHPTPIDYPKTQDGTGDFSEGNPNPIPDGSNPPDQDSDNTPDDNSPPDDTTPDDDESSPDESQ